MGHSDVAAGHRARASIRLDEADRSRLLDSVIVAGGRSVLFRFHDVPEGESDMFGAEIEGLEILPGDRLIADLWFWYDGAAIYATPGAAFDIWYGRRVGDGTVLPESGVEPAGAVPSILNAAEVPALRDLDDVLGPLIAELGDRPDADYLQDPRWKDVVEAAQVALGVMENSDG